MPLLSTIGAGSAKGFNPGVSGPQTITLSKVVMLAGGAGGGGAATASPAPGG